MSTGGRKKGNGGPVPPPGGVGSAVDGGAGEGPARSGTGSGKADSGAARPKDGALAAAFARCKEEKRPAFVPFLMAGDPDLETTGKLMAALARGGADVIELGVPFSDPIADGPVNQAAATRALRAGTRLPSILGLVSRHREELGVPVVLFSYYNPILARGLERFAEDASAAGVDGVLCVDLPPEEAEEEYVPALRGRGLDTIFLLSPTSGKDRIAKVARASSGFVYYVSRTGVTGERAALAPELVREVKRVRRKVGMPVAVGFGISTPEQVAEVGGIADGVVVGSALVRLVAERGGDPGLPEMLEEKVRELTGAIRGGAKGRGGLLGRF